MSESALLKGLNDVQKQAAMHKDGPLVVFAGAGSGKTRIITTRIAYLVEQGVRPWQILAVTFTNKAAQEMRERVARMSFEGAQVPIATFHSICARWLREFGGELGFTSDFTIYDESDSHSALKAVVEQMFPNRDTAPFLADLKHFIQKTKVAGILPGEVEAKNRDAFIPAGGTEAYKRYQEYLAKCNAMDFSDLILNVLLLLRRNEKVRTILQKRYQYVLVDEFQDTNASQMELVETICSKHHNLFVVGDDDQSIYSWRGATPSNILNFEKKFPTAKRITMAQNYRSTSNIVAAAGAMVAKNLTRAEKELFSEVPAGDPIEYVCERDGQTESWYVSGKIKDELVKYHYSDIAVFYRTNAQSRLLEETLRAEKIPYTIYGSVKFYERMEVKDVVGYLRLLVNEDDDVSLARVINVPARGIGDRAVDQLREEATRRDQSMMKTLRQMVAEKTPKLGTKFSVFETIFSALKNVHLKSGLGELIPELIDLIDYRAYLQKKYADQFDDKNENIHELADALASYASTNKEATLSDWLQSITMQGADEDTDGVEAEKGISLMTLHIAKGLEFKRVFIVGVEDGLIPHRSNVEDKKLLEEERRLFYVGMTRAREKLTFIGAVVRRTYDQSFENPPSRFLRDIPAELLQVDRSNAQAWDEGLNDVEAGVRYVSLDDELETGDLAEGAQVRHPSYGRGVIEGFQQDFGRRKAVVRFFDFGIRSVAIHQLERR